MQNFFTAVCMREHLVIVLVMMEWFYFLATYLMINVDGLDGENHDTYSVYMLVFDCGTGRCQYAVLIMTSAGLNPTGINTLDMSRIHFLSASHVWMW